MYKAILYGKNLQTLKTMYNTIFKIVDNSCINLTKIITNEEELLNLEEDLNLIIFYDFEITTNNLIPLIKKFETKIIFTNEISNSKNSKYTLYLPIEPNEQYTCDKLPKFVLKHNKNYISKRVRQILESIDLDFRLIGSNYLVEAITYSYMHKDEYLFENLEKNIYPQIAKRQNLDVENIKWAITRSLDYLKIHSPNIDIIKFNDKLTPKLLITQVINLI